MKKFVLSIALFSFALCVFSQENSEKIKTNEVSLDWLDLALFRTIDVSYEYVKNADWGFGATTRYNFDKDNPFDEKYSVTPFFRYYFFNKKDYGSKGFYAESFLKLYGGEITEYNYLYTDEGYLYEKPTEKTFFEAALGIGLGFKYVSKRGFVLDLNLGGGRPLGISDYNLDFVGRSSVSFGYRF